MITTKRFAIPYLKTGYTNIYSPAPDTYLGLDDAVNKHGTQYHNWTVNDFTIIKSDGEIHIFGITHPTPPDFVDHFTYDPETVHLGENQLFHAVADTDSFASLTDGCFTDREKILYPQSRPNELEQCWAPCIVEKDGTYHIFYSPRDMRYATGTDLYSWTPRGTLFSGLFMMRDPYVFLEDGLYYMVYVTDHLYFRTSSDLFHWSGEEVFQRNPFSDPSHGYGCAQESPCLFKKDGDYYLAWCIHDGRNGCYDERTFIFASQSLTGGWDTAPLAIIEGHATEIVSQDGQYYALSAFYPQNGINIAQIGWR